MHEQKGTINKEIINKRTIGIDTCTLKVTQLCLTLRPHELYSLWNSLGQNTGVGSLSLLQGIFQTQGSHPGLHISGGFFTI